MRTQYEIQNKLGRISVFLVPASSGEFMKRDIRVSVSTKLFSNLFTMHVGLEIFRLKRWAEKIKCIPM